MAIRRALTIVMALCCVSPAIAEQDREEATWDYLELLAEQMAENPRPPVDPAIALEGFCHDTCDDGVPEGYVIIDGDIQISIEKYELLLQEGSTAAVFGDTNYWPGGIVPFDFNDNVNAARRQLVIDAMDAISARCGVQFRERLVSDSSWIRFRASAFNNSAVGRQGDMQVINIVSWDVQIIIIHEIYHALGFWHQQSAPDRDNYVTIQYDDVCGSSSTPGHACHPATCQGCEDRNGNFVSCAHNFNIRAAASTWGPYDFDSFLHYPTRSFSCTGNDTIVVNQPWHDEWQDRIGQRTHFSLVDELSCRGIYPFTGDRWLRTGIGGLLTGTFFHPYRGTFSNAFSFTPQNGTLLIDPGSYSGTGEFSQPKTLRGTYGLVIIGQ